MNNRSILSVEKRLEYTRNWRTKNSDYVHRYNKSRYQERKTEILERTNRWKKNNPDKVRARNALDHAIQRGDIKRKPCSICGDKNVDGHHFDYSKPLEVIWLCRSHHNQLHNKLKKSENT